jgi:putative transcriptional regulator
MDDGAFQWDDVKAAKNYAKHGVTFEAARDVIKDPFALDWVDDGQDEGEQRFATLGMVEGRLLFVAYAMRGDAIRIISARLPEPLRDEDIMTKTKHDWRRADAMTENEIHAAALADPDAQPLTPERLARMRRTPQVRIIRRALGLSQEEFATRFHIPLGTLRDWEQGRKDPDAAARAYLVVIGRNPTAVAEALRSP